MTMSGLLSFLEERLPGKFQINAPMERYTTFRVGGPADLLVEYGLTGKQIAEKVLNA